MPCFAVRSPCWMRRGGGCACPRGPAALAFARGVLGASHWPWRARLALLRAAVGWRSKGFVAPAGQTVAELVGGLPDVLVRELIDPLCVAALNTPSDQASAAVFLRVLRDALFGGPGASDLLLPRLPLAQLVPDPAFHQLTRRGAAWRLRTRVQTIVDRDGAWQVDGECFDGVVLACSASEAARLAGPIDPGWSRRAAAVRYQSIITVYASHEDARLPWPMVALDHRQGGPAQFVFDHGILSGRPGLLAFVASGANSWLERGLEATAKASCDQARAAFGTPWADALQVVHTVAEKRATFACTPGLDRPQARIRPRLWAAGDYVEGPYPATLEGAVRAGHIASAGLLDEP